MTCGVYQILNANTGKSYVGSSHEIEVRWQRHRMDCRNGKAGSIRLQNSWNKHGEEAFTFSILEEIPLEQLFQREAYWIGELDSYNHGYNMLGMELEGARVYRTHCAETKLKLSEAGKKTWALHREALTEKAKQRAQDPTFKEGLHEASRSFHKLPADHPKKLKWLASIRASRCDPDYLLRRSILAKQWHQDNPEAALKARDRLHTEEVNALRRERMQDPTVRSKVLACNALKKDNPQYADECRKRTKERFASETPEARELRIQACKESNTAEKRQKFREAMLGRSWWHNPATQERSRSQECPGEGWLPGRGPNRKKS